MRITALVLVGLLAALPPANALAQPTPPTEDARAAFERGVTFMEAGAWEDARREIERSLALQSTQVALINLATCLSRLDRPADAATTLDRFLREFGETGTAELVARVRRDLAALELRVGRVRIRTSQDGAEVLVDGQVVGRSPLERPLFLLVGPHRFEARLAGTTNAVLDAPVQAQAEREIVLELREVPIVLAAPRPLPRPRPEPVEPPARAVSTSRAAHTWYVLFTTVTALALITAASAGTFVLVDSYDYRNDQNRTREQQDRGNALTLVVDVSFAIGIVTAVAAAIFYGRSRSEQTVVP